MNFSLRSAAALWTSYRLSSARRMAEAVVRPSVKCIGPSRRAAHCARPCHDAERRLAPVTLRGLLDSTDARRSAEGRSGQMDGPLSHCGRALTGGPAGAPWLGSNRI